MPVQNAAKKKGILSLSYLPLALRHGEVKDAAALSAQRSQQFFLGGGGFGLNFEKLNSF